MVEIVEADITDVPLVRALFAEYREWLGVDLCFQGFAGELANLPGAYAAPGGAVLIALVSGKSCGCVAFRPLSGSEAELKRLYVRPDQRGRGVGKALFIAVMDKARTAGYQSIVLDTLPSMKTAQTMYREHGFVEIDAYYPNPEAGVKYFRYVF